jgi:hypothetical protein
LSNEFQRHAGKVRRWIVRHDTQILGERGEDGGPGLLPAVRRFLNENREWSVIHHTQANHGLTVLSRDPRDKPALPGTIKMAANFTKSLGPWLHMWLMACRRSKLRSFSNASRSARCATNATTTAAVSVAVTSPKRRRGDPVSVRSGNGIRKRRCLMSNELPMVSCLCPTYRRSKLLENSIACFLAQNYPADRRELIVLDDAGKLQNQTGDGWQIISIPRRFRSLPEKFNALAGLAYGEILVVWEDDDIYLPHHISSHVTAMEGHLWSKPSKVLSDYTGQIQEEDATGPFHASLAFTRRAFEQVGGWPLPLRGDFDQ